MAGNTAVRSWVGAFPPQPRDVNANKRSKHKPPGPVFGTLLDTYLPNAHLQSDWSGPPRHWHRRSCSPPACVGEAVHPWGWPAGGVIHWPNTGDGHWLPEAEAGRPEAR